MYLHPIEQSLNNCGHKLYPKINLHKNLYWITKLIGWNEFSICTIGSFPMANSCVCQFYCPISQRIFYST